MEETTELSFFKARITFWTETEAEVIFRAPSKDTAAEALISAMPEGAEDVTIHDLEEIDSEILDALSEQAGQTIN